MSEIATAGVDRRSALKTFAAAGLYALGSPLLLGSEHSTDDPLAAILPSFTPESRRKLQSTLSARGFSGQIPSSVVRDLIASEKKSLSTIMLGLLPLARTYSHPPISNYRVGVVARGEGDSLYLGFNIEFPGHALGFAVHGEQAALSSAYMHGESGVAAIALTAAPCGHCRQFMNELSPDGQIEILVEGAAPMKLSSLLPMAFGPKDLGRKQGAFPIQVSDLGSSSGTPQVSGQRTAANLGYSQEALVQAALDAARRSYAPYSGAQSGIAIASRSGRTYKGSYIENVAFNPSLSPLQTALVQMIVGGQGYAEISRVVLVESAKAKISQKSVTGAVLSAIAPSARWETVEV
jgi:cytidine deaminase